MTLDRFIRDYQCNILADGVQAVIRPPVRSVFEITKSVSGGLNKAVIQFYNLSSATRLRIVKDAEEFEKDFSISFFLGFQNRIELAFVGSILRCSNRRMGADIVTTIEAYDGGYGVMYRNMSETVETADEAVDAIIANMPRVEKGKITARGTYSRPKVLEGSIYKCLDSILNEGETWYIEDEKLYITNDREVADNFVPVVSAKTGLIGTPEREASIVTFQVLIDPTLKIGRLAKLASTTAPHLNGIYKIQDVDYSGDNYGNRWQQRCRGILAPEPVYL